MTETKTMKMLKVHRERKNVSLRDLSSVIGVNYSTISYWESGKRNPKGKNSKQLEDFFGVPINELMEDIPEETLERMTSA